MARFTGDILAFSPPLIINEDQIQEMFSTVGDALKTVA